MPPNFLEHICKHQPFAGKHKSVEACHPHERGRDLEINLSADSPYHNGTPSGNLHAALIISAWNVVALCHKKWKQKGTRNWIWRSYNSNETSGEGASSSKSVGFSLVNHQSSKQIDKKITAEFKQSFPLNKSCSPADTATRRHFPHSNNFRLTRKLAFRQKTLIP